LVTGGAGFIGSNNVKFLIEHGHDVTILDNLMSGYRCNIERFGEVEFFEGDIRDDQLINKAASRADVIFHLAASVRNTRSIEHPIEDSEINILGTVRVLEAARRAEVRKVVFSSSAGIFGEITTLPIREDHPAEPTSPYGASKLGAEKICLAYAKLYPLQCVCLRYFNVYGVNQRYDAYGNVIPIFAHRMLNGEPIIIFGDGEQTRDFVNVRDVVQANYLASLQNGLSGAFNIGSGTRIVVNRLAELLSDTCGLELKVQHRPTRPGDVRHSLADISAARVGFGYEPKAGMEDGLMEYLGLMRSEKERNAA